MKKTCSKQDNTPVNHEDLAVGQRDHVTHRPALHPQYLIQYEGIQYTDLPSGKESSSTHFDETSGVIFTQVESAGYAAIAQVSVHWSGCKSDPPQKLFKRREFGVDQL